MMAPKGSEVDAGQMKIILGLLTHPRMINLRAQFRDELQRTMSKPDVLKKIEAGSGIKVEDLQLDGKRLADDLKGNKRLDEAALGEYADVALAFCYSAGFLNFWGHFTSTLQKLIRDDSLIADVAACSGVCSKDRVLYAIRQFSDMNKMPVGRAGL